jgi:hypothetical protein
MTHLTVESSKLTLSFFHERGLDISVDGVFNAESKSFNSLFSYVRFNTLAGVSDNVGSGLRLFVSTS